MIPKSVQRFSDKILLKQETKSGREFEEKSSDLRRVFQHHVATSVALP
jgi:hypothetical protein